MTPDQLKQHIEELSKSLPPGPTPEPGSREWQARQTLQRLSQEFRGRSTQPTPAPQPVVSNAILTQTPAAPDEDPALIASREQRMEERIEADRAWDKGFAVAAIGLLAFLAGLYIFGMTVALAVGPPLIVGGILYAMKGN
jgi:hypothetical protein